VIRTATARAKSTPTPVVAAVNDSLLPKRRISERVKEKGASKVSKDKGANINDVCNTTGKCIEFSITLTADDVSAMKRKRSAEKSEKAASDALPKRQKSL